VEQRPYIDEHSQRVDAPADVVWTALLKVLCREMGGSALIARILGCDPAQGTAEFAGRPGEALVLGRLYRAAVIGSGGHRLVTRRLLRQVARAT
jgi:hypothetical protein